MLRFGRSFSHSLGLGPKLTRIRCPPANPNPIGNPMLQISPNQSPSCGQKHSLRRTLPLVALTFALIDAGCGGAIESADPSCRGTTCNGDLNPGVGGAATASTVGGTTSLLGSGGSIAIGLPAGGAGATAIAPSTLGGGTSGPVSVIVTQTMPLTSLADLTGVFFTVTDRPGSSTLGASYTYPPTLPTRADTYNACGETVYIFTCDANLPDCLTIAIDWQMRATATLMGPDSMQRTFVGYVDGIKAPLLPLTDPPQYSFTGSFEFADVGYPNVSLKGNFSVRFDHGSTTSSNYLIIC